MTNNGHCITCGTCAVHHAANCTGLRITYTGATFVCKECESDTTTTVISCDCAVCGNRQARINGDGIHNGKPMSRAMRHNFVQIAHGPFAVATAARGPWAVIST